MNGNSLRNGCFVYLKNRNIFSPTGNIYKAECKYRIFSFVKILENYTTHILGNWFHVIFLTLWHLWFHSYGHVLLGISSWITISCNLHWQKTIKYCFMRNTYVKNFTIQKMSNMLTLLRKNSFKKPKIKNYVEKVFKCIYIKNEQKSIITV